MPATSLPIIVLGAGGIVRDAHLPAYRKAGFEVAGVYNRHLERAERLATDFAIPCVYDSLEQAIDDAPADAIFDVALPAAAQPAVLLHLPDGAPVLLQKPLGENLDQAKEILRICHQKNLRVAVNFQLRYAPFVIAARNLIERGIIGELLDLEIRVVVETPWHLWTFLEGVPFAEIYYHSIHYLDLCRSFLGDPVGVYAKTLKHPDAHRIDGTRSAYLLDYGDRVRTMITANHHHRYGSTHQEAYIQWSGTSGAIRASMGLLRNYPEGIPDVFEICRIEDSKPKWRRIDIPGSWFPDAFVGTMASVMRVAEGRETTMPTAVDDAYRTMLVVDAACRSSASGATKLLAT